MARPTRNAYKYKIKPTGKSGYALKQSIPLEGQEKKVTRETQLLVAERQKLLSQKINLNKQILFAGSDLSTLQKWLQQAIEISKKSRRAGANQERIDQLNSRISETSSILTKYKSQLAQINDKLTEIAAQS